MSPTPGWYPDPAATDTQRYWDGEQWVGDPLPAGSPPPAAPPGAAARTASPAAAPTAAAKAPAPATPVQAGPDPASPARTRDAAAADPLVPVNVPGTAAPVMLDIGRLAPLGRRVAARAIDVAVVLGLNILVNGYFFVKYLQLAGPVVEKALSAGNANPLTVKLPDEANNLVIVMVVVAMALWLAYEVPATANSGQTLGKRMVGIRVRRVDDSALTMGQSLRRWLILALPSPLVLSFCGLPLQLADLLWCVWDRPARQCLHDKAVASVVVLADRATTAAGPIT